MQVISFMCQPLFSGALGSWVILSCPNTILMASSHRDKRFLPTIRERVRSVVDHCTTILDLVSFPEVWILMRHVPCMLLLKNPLTLIFKACGFVVFLFPVFKKTTVQKVAIPRTLVC